VLSPKKDEAPFADLYRRHPEAFLYVSGSESTWRHTRPQVVSEVDAMITIGGADGTYQVGLEIKLARKRLVPIAAFGGASSRLLQELLTSEGLRQPDLFKRLNNPWSRSSASHVMAVLGANEPSKVLLIHGHAQDRTILQDWLKAQELAHPVVMAQEFTSGQTLPEKFESLAAEADAAIALVTPDDLASSEDQMDIKRKRARQNVWVEVGWFWGRLGLERILLLVRGDVEVPSDLDGIEYLPYEHSPLQAEDKIRAFLLQVSERNQ
jgi:predicted nucleotide-binding protein